jgi:hypothetical protein
MQKYRSPRPDASDPFSLISGLGLLMILFTGAIVGALLPLGDKSESTAPVATPTPAPHTAPSEQTRLVIQ